MANTSTITSRIIKTEPIDWRKLEFIQDDDFKSWIDNGNEKLIDSIIKFQFVDPFKVWRDGDKIYCLDGKHRYLDLIEIEKSGVEVPKKLPATFLDCKDLKDAAELVLIYSSAYAEITKDGLLNFSETFDIDLPDFKEISLPNFDELELNELSSGSDCEESEKQNALKDDFGIVPFSILDSRSGEWMQRKREWKAIGLDSQETREDIELIAKSGQSSGIYNLKNRMREAYGREPEWDEVIDYAKKKGMHVFEGASIFDPVLCELIYNWFCPENANILDPFAGGSVRGVVAGKLGHKYKGIDLRKDQVEANRKQAKDMAVDNVQWETGDAKDIGPLYTKADFIFSCPPYHDLEEYSDDPKDLSNMDYQEFIRTYRSIILKSVQNLKDDSFACFVVGDIRDKNGYYRNFVSETIDAFRSSGMELYNEMILINSIGSMAMRLRRQFNSGRKCGKIHQNVLVFFKGNPKNIKEKFGEINFEDCLSSEEMNPNIEL